MIKIRKSKKIIIGIILICFGVSLPTFKYCHNNHLDKIDEKKVEDFFNEPIQDEEITSLIKDDSLVKENPSISYNYIAVLEIPTISLKRGLVSKDSKSNNVNQNIQILKESTLPDVDNGIFMLASHSGTSRISFFKTLHYLKYDDEIYVYYNNIKYVYKVVNVYMEKKDGDITIHRDNNKTTIVLTTCSQEHKGNQIVVIGELINKENY